MKFAPYLFAIPLLSLNGCGDDYWIPIAGWRFPTGVAEKRRMNPRSYSPFAPFRIPCFAGERTRRAIRAAEEIYLDQSEAFLLSVVPSA